MERSEQYRRRVASLTEDVRKSGNPAVIFGAGRAGWYIMKVLEYYGVPIAAFSDNDPRKQTAYCNYQVLSPGDIAAGFPDAHIFLGVFIPDTARAVGGQFRGLNCPNTHFETAAFLFAFLTSVAGRKCDEDILARSIHVLFENYREGPIHYGLTGENYFVSPFVTGVITQKCSLRCRDCAQLMPYYKEPVHFPVDSVIRDLRLYAKAFDVIPEISLHGGEPFLHPDLAEICGEVAAIPNIVFISFVTNGTIMLPDETLQRLSACGADVHQSGGYGPLSRKRDALAEGFSRHGIYSDTMFCSPTELWLQAGPCRKHSRTPAANDAQYKKCVATKTCCQIMSGELHRCSLSMHGSHQGLFPKCDADFVRLHESGRPNGMLTGEIRDFLTRDRALSVCDYCETGGRLVQPAIQLEPVQRAVRDRAREEVA